MIEVSKVKVPKRLRQVDQDKVDELAKSILEIGLITPIVINRDVLVCGNHRLEAFKQLGIKQIPYTVKSDTTKEDQDLLIEIDENLVRNELTPRQRERHIELKAKILAKRYKDKYLEQAIKATAVRKNQDADKLRIKVLEADNFRHDLGELPQKIAKNIKDVFKSAESNALAEAKKEIAFNLGHKDSSEINKAISNSEAITNANLDEAKLDQLTGVQLKEVARVAKKEPEKAKLVLDQQIELNKAKEAGEIPNNASGLVNDPQAKIGKDIGVVRSARSLVKKYSKIDGLSKSDIGALEEYLIASEEVIEVLKKHQSKVYD